MQNFNEFLKENYNLTEEEFFDMDTETSTYDNAMSIIWAEWNAYVKQYIK